MIQLRYSFAFLFALLLALAPADTSAAETAHFVKVGTRQIFVNYRPAKPEQPTIVLLNGLTYSTTDWDAYVAELTRRNPGLGILRFDMIGMGSTLLKGTLPVDYAIPYTDQVELTAQLMKQLGLGHAFIGGLSYGGGIAIAFGLAHPEMVDQLILMAPFTEPLQSMDQAIQSEVAANRLEFPLNPASDDDLYDYFLRQFIYSTYPSLEPSVVENPFKLEGVYRMVQGIRKYETLKEIVSPPLVATHLMVADQDQYIPKEVHDRFWKALPGISRMSRIDISYTEHKMPQAIPAYAAAWTTEILKRNPALNQGLAFQGSTQDGNARSGSLVLKLP